jgi:hypothetical protein
VCMFCHASPRLAGAFASFWITKTVCCASTDLFVALLFYPAKMSQVQCFV